MPPVSLGDNEISLSVAYGWLCEVVNNLSACIFVYAFTTGLLDWDG